MQTKRHSILESVVNTVLGVIIGISVSQFVYHIEPFIQNYIYHNFVWQLTLESNIIMTLVFALLSIIRGYVVRRVFNRKIINPAGETLDQFIDKIEAEISKQVTEYTENLKTPLGDFTYHFELQHEGFNPNLETLMTSTGIRKLREILLNIAHIHIVIDLQTKRESLMIAYLDNQQSVMLLWDKKLGMWRVKFIPTYLAQETVKQAFIAGSLKTLT